MIDTKMRLETEKFNRFIAKFARRSNLSTGVVVKKFAFDLLKSILKAPPKGRHPVDTGRARAGWYASVIGLGGTFDFNSRITGENQVDRGKREGSFIDDTKGVSPNKSVTLINGVDYIVFLEYGHSQQAPAGMVRISMRKLRGVLPRRINQEFIEEWKKFRF